MGGSRNQRRTARLPAAKFPHLQKRMQQTRTAARLAKGKKKV